MPVRILVLIGALLLAFAAFAAEPEVPGVEEPADDKGTDADVEKPADEAPSEVEPDPKQALIDEAMNRGLAIVGGLERSEVEPELREKAPKFATCYNKQWKKNPDLAGTCVFEITIGTDGLVDEAEAVYTEFDNIKLERCIRMHIKKVDFRKPRGDEPATVYYKLRFKL